MKICPECDQPNEFYVDNSRKDGLNYRCIPCRKLFNLKRKDKNARRSREYYIENKEHIDKRNKLYNQNNKEAMTKTRHQHVRNNRELLLLQSAQSRSRAAGKDCTITLEDIVIPTKCPYLNIEITNIVGQGHILTNASLDRIDNTKGYTKGNIQVISRLANSMKNNTTKDQLITFAKNVLKIHPINNGE